MSKNIATRESYGNALKRLGAENENLVVLDADLSKSTKTAVFGAEFPERHFNMGIAEQNMVGVSCRSSCFRQNSGCFIVCDVRCRTCL